METNSLQYKRESRAQLAMPWRKCSKNRQLNGSEEGKDGRGGSAEEWKRGRIEGGRKLESIRQAKKRKLELAVYAIGVVSMEEDLNSLILSIFLSLNNKKERTFSLRRRRLGACCLTILILLRVLNVLRGRCDHATPTFAEFKV